jgi:hypothetical protein
VEINWLAIAAIVIADRYLSDRNDPSEHMETEVQRS